MENKKGIIFATDRKNLEVIIEKIFNASPETLFQAFTEPSLIAEWWGPANKTVIVEEMEPKEGGLWRYACHNGEREDVFHGSFLRINEPHLISRTLDREGAREGHEIIETITFDDMRENSPEEGWDKTKVTSVSKYRSLKDLEAALGNGIEQETIESWKRLDKLLEELSENEFDEDEEEYEEE